MTEGFVREKANHFLIVCHEIENLEVALSVTNQQWLSKYSSSRYSAFLSPLIFS